MEPSRIVYYFLGLPDAKELTVVALHLFGFRRRFDFFHSANAQSLRQSCELAASRAPQFLPVS